MTDGGTHALMDGGDFNIPNAFLKKCGDKINLVNVGPPLAKLSRSAHVTSKWITTNLPVSLSAAFSENIPVTLFSPVISDTCLQIL